MKLPKATQKQIYSAKAQVFKKLFEFIWDYPGVISPCRICNWRLITRGRNPFKTLYLKAYNIQWRINYEKET